MFAHHGVAAFYREKKEQGIRQQSFIAIPSWGNGPMEFWLIVTDVLKLVLLSL